MTICCNSVKDLKCKNLILFQLSVALVVWTCCCFQGDEARPVSVSHVSPITCHVIFEKTHRRHVTKPCSCKCWIWCKNTIKCRKKSLQVETQLLQQQQRHLTKQSYIFKVLAAACSSCCQKDSNTSFPNGAFLQRDFKCNINPHHTNSSYCDNHPIYNTCCSAICSSAQNEGSCLYFYPNDSIHENFTSENRNVRKLKNVLSAGRKTGFFKRRKRSSKFHLPYHIEVLDDLNDYIVDEPFNLRVQLADKLGSIVPDTGHEIELKIIGDEEEKEKREIVRKVLLNGKVDFPNVFFKHPGSGYRLLVASRDSPAVLAWTSEKLTVSYRPFELRPSGRSLPISPRENQTLSPAAGVIIYDVTNNKPASKAYLSQFSWVATISLFYDDVYPGELLGTTTQLVQDGSNEIIFHDIVISQWGYSYILRIDVRAKDAAFWNLTFRLGPFDVDMINDYDLPLMDSDDFRRFKLVYDSNYNVVRGKTERFGIQFLNFFGRDYSTVRWKNLTIEDSEGSIIVDFVITGLAKALDPIASSLKNAIQGGNANIKFDHHLLEARNLILPPSRKLLEEAGSGDQSSDEGAGGLSVAWIVAIVVNVILIVVFIIAIIYCYCRRKKQREVSRSASNLQNFHGTPNPMMFSNKAENKNGLHDKAHIFTVEDSRMGKHRSMSGRTLDGEKRCTCPSPDCYCSTGDGRKTDMSLHHSEEENEDDPQGYPTPSPEPRFPTPKPSPEPEDYWRPDSYPQQEEEEPEEEEMFLPGAVSDPSPEIPLEERFYVYLLTDIDGSRELIGQIYLKVDSFLSETRRAMDRDRDLSDAIRGREYHFLDENLDEVPNYQESSLDLERMFPSQGINIQYLPPKLPTPKPEVPTRPKVPAYVGPLGICNAPDCTRAAKIKCLDCRNVAYCSKRCMKEDAKDHKRVCYKPAWRL